MTGHVRSPVVAAWGAGANSTAMIIELVRRGAPPDMVLLAAMPEQPRTRALIPLFRDWMDAHGVANEIVEYRVMHCKHWPPYNDLLEACLTNGTLPSIAFGLHSCSARHKISPQDKWVKAWPPAQHAWTRGGKVIRLIGYDCSPRDGQRYAHREGHVSDLYDYRYPLREWGWDRDDCDRCIADAGLPVFPKSSCFFLCLHTASRLTASICFESYKNIVYLRHFQTIEALGTGAKRYCTLPLSRAQPPKAEYPNGGGKELPCDIKPMRTVRSRTECDVRQLRLRWQLLLKANVQHFLDRSSGPPPKIGW